MSMERSRVPGSKPYAEVQALVRGIALLTELNKVGHARASELARVTGIDRTTTYRLLATLENLGLVAQRLADNQFVLAPDVRTLSNGFIERDELAQIVSLHLGSLFQKVAWPSDFATFDFGSMVIQDTTHHFSPYSVHRAMVGRSRPLFASAMGRAFIAGCSEEQRKMVVQIARSAQPEELGLSSSSLIDPTVDHIVAEFDRLGFASSVGETESHISAIALPIRTEEWALGSINIVFFRSVMSPNDAAERYLPYLQNCVDAITWDFLAISRHNKRHEGTDYPKNGISSRKVW